MENVIVYYDRQGYKSPFIKLGSVVEKLMYIALKISVLLHTVQARI